MPITTTPGDPEPLYVIAADLTDNAPPSLTEWGWLAVVDPAVGGVVAYAHPAFMSLLLPLLSAARGSSRAALDAALTPFRTIPLA